MSRFPEVVTARATRAERKIIDAAAAEAGETVSEFVRRTAVREARRHIGGSERDEPRGAKRPQERVG